jgi:hypothetical protein
MRDGTTDAATRATTLDPYGRFGMRPPPASLIRGCFFD